MCILLHGPVVLYQNVVKNYTYFVKDVAIQEVWDSCHGNRHTDRQTEVHTDRQAMRAQERNTLQKGYNSFCQSLCQRE